MQETWVQSLGREDPLEKEMATHSSILVWKIPWMEELGGLRIAKSRTRPSNFTFMKKEWSNSVLGLLNYAGGRMDFFSQKTFIKEGYLWQLGTDPT